ncbi:hypothetical protein WG66_013571 [Moniliophthora roreri]|nr:hypothetical protein WG66_013571 [Moniliophthora roreri]
MVDHKRIAEAALDRPSVDALPPEYRSLQAPFPSFHDLKCRDTTELSLFQWGTKDFKPQAPKNTAI